MEGSYNELDVFIVTIHPAEEASSQTEDFVEL